MALFSRFRQSKLPFLQLRRCSVLSTDSNTTLPSPVSKARAALSLLKSEENPDRILEICRAASLNPEFRVDRVVFSVAIDKLSTANRFNVIDAFLQELRNRGDLQNERFAAHSLILYGQAKMIDRAIAAFDEFHKEGLCRSAKTLNALIIACKIAGEYGKVNEIFLNFPKRYGVNPNLDTFNAVIKAYTESGSSSSAYKVVADMEKQGINPKTTTFGHMLAGFYKEEKYEDVGKVLKMMEDRGFAKGLTIFNIRVKSLCKLKRSGEAKALVEGLLSRGKKPDSETYNHLILGFGNEGNFEEAKSMFKMMRETGCEPDYQCYYTMVHFLCQTGDFETALRFCTESMEKNWIPYFTDMTKLVIGLASIGKVEEAHELVEQLKERFGKDAEKWDEIQSALPPY